MHTETLTKINRLLEIVDRLPPEHQARFSILVELLSAAPQPATDQARRLIWSAIGVSRVSRGDCLFRLDSAIEFLRSQCASKARGSTERVRH